MAKVALLLALIVVVLLAGLPVVAGMGAMEPCPSCPAPDAPIAFAMCSAILAFAAMTIVLRPDRVLSSVVALKTLLFVTSLERPPRPA